MFAYLLSGQLLVWLFQTNDRRWSTSPAWGGPGYLQNCMEEGERVFQPVAWWKSPLDDHKES